MSMRRKVKKVLTPVCIFLLICFGLLFSSVGYLSHNLPTSVSYTESTDLLVSGIFPVSALRDESASEVRGSARETDGEYTAVLKLFGIFPVGKATVRRVGKSEVQVLGKPFGIKIYSDGVMVVGISTVDSPDGDREPASDAGITVGDVITSVSGIPVMTNGEVAAAVSSGNGESVKVTVRRNGDLMSLDVTPAYSVSEKCYRIGLWVRDSSAGIGTLTFYDPSSGIVAGLGHGISDRTTGDIIPLADGEMVGAEILGVEKSTGGSPGELRGRFTSASIGTLCLNSEAGVYGTAKSVFGTDRLYTVALKQEVVTGKAAVLTTVQGSGEQFFECEIEKIRLGDQDGSQNMVIRMTDSRLLALSGGIVQGMSGSPIIQNGKLIGAVTHVLVNDPARGYAIFAENMLETAQSVVNDNKLKDAS